MSARIASNMNGSLLLRGALLVGAALALAACAGGQKAVKKEKDAATYNTQLGIAYLRQGEIPLAKEKLDRALQENPNNPGVHSARAMLYDRLGDSAKADGEFQTALKLAPHDPELSNNYAVYLCRIGRTDEGVRRFEEAAHNALYRTPEAAFTNAGVCLHSAKRDDEAARNFKQALVIRPNFAEAAYQLVDMEFQRGNLIEARGQVDTYTGTFTATPDLLLLGVRITRALGDRLAAEHYARKLRLDFPSSDQTRALANLDRNPG
jgi:type IV pilus assembly protein PilF